MGRAKGTGEDGKGGGWKRKAQGMGGKAGGMGDRDEEGGKWIGESIRDG